MSAGSEARSATAVEPAPRGRNPFDETGVVREELLAPGEQALLGAGRIVHERIGDEAERAIAAVGPAFDDPVREHQRAALRHVQRRVVRADRIERARDHTARELCPDVETEDLLAPGKLVESLAVAQHHAPEAPDEAPRFAVVVAVGEQDHLGLVRSGDEPVETLLRRDERIDEHACVVEPVRGDLDVDLGVPPAPVKETREDLLGWAHSDAMKSSIGIAASVS